MINAKLRADRFRPTEAQRESDPAGAIGLTGRNRVCDRARVLAGMFLSSGIAASLDPLDTSVSFAPAMPA